jgi:hypothetical protein
MTNPFERHQLEHLSPSHVNTFWQDKATWYARYIQKKDMPVGPPAKRGDAVEAGLQHWHAGQADDERTPTDVTLDTFAELTADMDQDEVLKQQKQLDGMIGNAIAGIDEIYGQVDVSLDFDVPLFQQRWEANLEGIEVPMMGFSDFYFPDQHTIIELKTFAARQLWRAPVFFHVMQCLFYRLAATQARDVEPSVYLLYAAPDGFRWYNIEDRMMINGFTASYELLERAAKAVRRFLELDADALKDICLPIPDPSGFRWKKEADLEVMHEVWEIGNSGN